MLNKKFFTHLLNDNYRKSILLKNDRIINDQNLKLKQYATYIVDKHRNDRDDNYKDIKQANYGFCPFDVFMWVAKDRTVKKLLFEFNSINHFLVEDNHSKAVEVAICMLSEFARENKKDIISFDIDKIEAESKKAQEAYDKIQEEIKQLVEDELSKQNTSCNNEQTQDNRMIEMKYDDAQQPLHVTSIWLDEDARKKIPPPEVYDENGKRIV